MMNLNNILDKINPIETHINNDMKFSKPEFDSRKIEKNDLFFAIRGTVADGHNFIEKAINSGAKIIICEELPKETNQNIS